MALPDPTPSQRVRERLRRILMPTGVSLAIHLVLLLVLATVTWQVMVRPSGGAPPGEVMISFDDPSSRVQDGEADSTSERASQGRPSTIAPVPTPDLPSPAPRVRVSQAAPSIAPPVRTPVQMRVPRRGISFAGVRADRAASVAYVVDTSGAMASSYDLIVDELERSLMRLDPGQLFQVVTFRDRSVIDGQAGPKASFVMAHGTMLPATPANRSEVIRQLREEVIPSGRSDPAPALELALGLHPDAIFLLTRSIRRTGPGQEPGTQVEGDAPPWSEAWRDALLERLERLNPRRGGSRRTMIVAIQFIDDDPTGTLQAIGARHAGPGGYVVRTREDFERLARAPAIDLIDQHIDDARRELDALARSGLDWLVLFGVSEPVQRQEVVRRARRVIASLGSPESLEDPRALLMLARAGALLAGASERDRGEALILVRRSLARLDGHDPALAPYRACIAALAGLDGDSIAASLDRLDPGERLECLLARVRHASASELADAWQTLTSELDTQQAPAVTRMLAHECAAQRAFELSAQDPSLGAQGVRFLLAIGSLDLGLPDEQQSALVMDRLRRLVPGGLDLASCPPEAQLAVAQRLADSGDRARAEELLRELRVRRDGEHLLAPTMLALGELLADDPSVHRRIEGIIELMTLARHFRDAPEARGAGERALVRARALVEEAQTPEARAIGLNAFHQVLRDARTIEDLPHRDFWLSEHDRVLLELAQFKNSTYSLHLLEEIRPGAPQVPEAVALYRRLVRSAIDEMLDLHMRTRDVPGAEETAETSLIAAQQHARHALAFYARHGVTQDTAFERARLARTYELMQMPGEARRAWTEVLPDADQTEEGRTGVLVRLARLEVDLGMPGEAFAHLREASERVQPDEARFWEVWTLMLEILSGQGDRDRSGTILAHAARLRTLDPDLGGDPWRTRIERVVRSARERSP